MTSTFVNTFFNEHSQYLNDIYGINYVENYDQLYGWTDHTSMFVDSIMLWCAYDMIQDDSKKMIKSFLGIISSMFVRYYEKNQFYIKYIRKGVWDSFDEESEELEIQGTFSEMGYIGINVTFHDICVSGVFHPLRRVLAELRKNSVILRSIDVTIDCGYISTRTIIEKYVLCHKLATKGDIVNDRKQVGDNCISFLGKSPLLNNANTRTKIYNKFIQALESSQVLVPLGSRLSHLVADRDSSYMDKLRRFLNTGYTRIELSVYGSTLFHLTSYERAMDELLDKLAGCPTYKVPLREQWHMIVDKLTQVAAVYVENTNTFAYCHWWNSLTKRKQGICKDNIKREDLTCFLTNFSFNDRVIHCFIIKQIENSSSYEIINHKRYMRAERCTAMTLTPGLSNSLFPSRSRLQIKDIMFADIGLDIYKNIHIEWPLNRLENTADRTVTTLVQSLDNDAFNLLSIRDALPAAALQVINSPQVSRYTSDRSCLLPNTSYNIIKYGYASFRGKMCLHLVLEEGLMVRCGNKMQDVIEPKLGEGVAFRFFVDNVSRRHVTCSIV